MSSPLSSYKRRTSPHPTTETASADTSAIAVVIAPEVADRLRRFDKQITPEGVRNRLEERAQEDLVSRKKLGARAVAWWAEVAPELNTETAETVDNRKNGDEWTEL